MQSIALISVVSLAAFTKGRILAVSRMAVNLPNRGFQPVARYQSFQRVRERAPRSDIRCGDDGRSAAGTAQHSQDHICEACDGRRSRWAETSGRPAEAATMA